MKRKLRAAIYVLIFAAFGFALALLWKKNPAASTAKSSGREILAAAPSQTPESSTLTPALPEKARTFDPNLIETTLGRNEAKPLAPLVEERARVDREFNALRIQYDAELEAYTASVRAGRPDTARSDRLDEMVAQLDATSREFGAVSARLSEVYRKSIYRKYGIKE